MNKHKILKKVVHAARKGKGGLADTTVPQFLNPPLTPPTAAPVGMPSVSGLGTPSSSSGLPLGGGMPIGTPNKLMQKGNAMMSNPLSGMLPHKVSGGIKRIKHHMASKKKHKLSRPAVAPVPGGPQMPGRMQLP